LISELRVLIRKGKYSYSIDDIVLILAIFLPVVVPIILSFFDIGFLGTSTAYLGFVILIGGFLLRQVSISILGKYFIPVVGIQKNQKAISKGPYKFIRHPSYAGLFFELIGFSLVMSNIYGLILIVFPFLPALIYRINKEEKYLSNNLNGYKEYQQKTYKLIPYIY